MKKLFEISFITFFASIIISIASAYCTVVGYGNIFTSAVVMTMVIAGVIEFGRVVLVYDLHHFWHQMPWIKKIPGLIMLLIAMSLSALGVFGFFSNAYSAKTKEVIPIELEVKQLESNIPLLESEIDLNNKQIADLQKTMNSNSMDKAIETYIEKEYVTKALNVKKDMQKQITGLMNDNKTLNNRIIDIKKQITSLQQEAESKAPTIAHLKYLAALLRTSNDNAVIIFIVMIMMVFDTLAMYLMITSDWIRVITDGTPAPKKLPPKPIVKPVIKKEEVIEPKIESVEPIIEEKNDEKVEEKPKIIEKITDSPKNDKPQVSENIMKNLVNNFILKKRKNNIEKKVSYLVKLLQEDESIINKKSFIKSLSMTPFIVQKLEEELGHDSELMVKIRSRLNSMKGGEHKDGLLQQQQKEIGEG